jgi:hypothetical protein
MNRVAPFVFAAAMAVSAVIPAAAQTQDQQPGAPVQLIPAPPPAPSPSPSPPSSAPPRSAAAAAPAGIGETNLAPVDASWADALPKSEAPLPDDRWSGMSRGVLRAMVARLEPSESPALRDLARRILLSGAAAPAGDDPADQPSLVLVRAAAAARLGAIAGAAHILDNFPGDKGKAADRLRIELAFAANDVSGGCQRVAAGLAHHRNVWWDEANIACQLLSGARDQAALALDVLHDRETAPDPLFDALLAEASGRPAKLDRKVTLTPLQVTLWAAGKRPLPPGLVGGLDAATAAAFAGSDEPPANRVAAAERAAALGAWTPERLGALYAKLTIPDAERTSALGDDKTAETPLGRATLFQLAAQAGAPAPRSAALLKFLAGAERNGLYFVAARLAAPIIVAIGPSVAIKSAAPSFIRALIAAGRAKGVTPWLALADPAIEAPLLILVRAGATDDKAVGDALASLARQSGPETAHRVGLFLALAAAEGLQPSIDALIALPASSHTAAMPGVTSWLMLRQAERAKYRGETTLAAVLLAQDGPHLAAEPVILLRSLDALHAAGLDNAARALGRDAAVSAGL